MKQLRSLLLLMLFFSYFFSTASFATCGPQSSWIADSMIPDTLPAGSFIAPWKTLNFSRACGVHDACYCTSGVAKGYCDTQFLYHLERECEWTYSSFLDAPGYFMCRAMAKAYHQGAVSGGGSSFVKAQRFCAAPPR